MSTARVLTALMSACLAGEIESVKRILADGAEVNARNADGNTAVWLACYSDSPEIIELLALGANSALETEDGFTALELAASLPVMKLLRTARGTRNAV